MSLSFRRSYKVLLDQSAAGNGAWEPLDTTYTPIYNAICYVSCAGGDWIKLEGSLQPMSTNPGTTAYSPTAVSIAIVSASNAVALDGPFAFIRAVKTGTVGGAKVELWG